MLTLFRSLSNITSPEFVIMATRGVDSSGAGDVSSKYRVNISPGVSLGRGG